MLLKFIGLAIPAISLLLAFGIVLGLAMAFWLLAVTGELPAFLTLMDAEINGG